MTGEQVRFSDLAHFTPKQQEADKLVSQFKYVLYGGAMGGGKSYWLRWSLLWLLLRWAKQGIHGVTVGLFCEDYPALKDRHLSKIGKEFPAWLGTYHADHKEHGRSFILNEEYGSGVIVFRNLDDTSKYQSAEFAAVGVDELTKNQVEVFEDLRTRMRWPGIPHVKFLAATNPGGIGHAWVKKLWLDKQFEENELEADQFAYLPALALDNPHLDPSYLRSLSGLPEDKRKAFLEGDWDIFKGQYFSEWRKTLHVVDPFTPHEFWRKFVSIDYGYGAPSAVYWHGIDSDGVDYIYRELYQDKLTYEQLAAEIVALTPPLEEIEYWVADPAIWAKKGETELSGMELMFNKHRAITGKGINIIKGNNDRLNGWNLMREYLKPFQQQDRIIAKLQVFSTCTELIRTLPSLIYDKHRVEDVDSDGEDHAPDSVRYGLMSRPRSAPKAQAPVDVLLSRHRRPSPGGANNAMD